MDDLGHGPAPRHGKRATGGILKIGHQVDKLDGPVLENLFQRIRYQTIVVADERQVFRLIGGKGLQGAQIGRGLHGNLVPRRNQGLADAIQNALGAARDQNLFGANRNAPGRQTRRQCFAKRGKPFGQTVLERIRRIGGQDPAIQLGNEFQGETLRGGNASGQRYHAGLGGHFQDFADGVDMHALCSSGQQILEIHGSSLKKDRSVLLKDKIF